jgi:hypothetical protein
MGIGHWYNRQKVGVQVAVIGGILTIFSGVLTASVTGFFGILTTELAKPASQSSSAASPPTLTTTAAPSVKSSSSSPVTSVRSSPGWSRQWGPGTLNFRSEANVNLDSVPPDVSSPLADSSFGLNGNTFHDDNVVVDWTKYGGGALSAASCADLISRFGGRTASPVTGHVYCAKSKHGKVAIITVDSISQHSNGNKTGALVGVTVWSHN